MEAALIGAAVTILLAQAGSFIRLSGQIRGVSSRMDEVANRLDRVDLEGLDRRVTRLEERMSIRERE